MCEHKLFDAQVDVSRLRDGLNDNVYMADIRISCAHCKQSFCFLNLPQGLDLGGPAMSADGTEARLAITPNERGTERRG